MDHDAVLQHRRELEDAARRIEGGWVAPGAKTGQKVGKEGGGKERRGGKEGRGGEAGWREKRVEGAQPGASPFGEGE